MRMAGQYVVSNALHETTGADQFDFTVYVKAAPGIDMTTIAATTAHSKVRMCR